MQFYKYIFLLLLFFSFGLLFSYEESQSSSFVDIRLFKLIKLSELKLSAKLDFPLIINNGNKIIKTNVFKSYLIKKNYSNKIRIYTGSKLIYNGSVQSIRIKSSNNKLKIGNERISPRLYKGEVKLNIIKNAKTSRYEWHCINTVERESYIQSVVQSEMGNLSKKIESLKSQAILSRSYSIQPRHRKDGYDFCDTTHCQVYKGEQNLDSSVKQAINETKNLFLTYQNKIVRAYYHSTCGGQTTYPSNVWQNSNNQSIEGVYDSDSQGNAYCKDSPHFSWETIIKRAKLMSMFLPGDNSESFDISNLVYDSSGRIKSMIIRSKNDWVKVSGESFRITVGRNMGWNNIKSSYFEFYSAANNSLLIKGYGLGHGVGLCQYGAIKLAELGKSYKEILKHYFPKCEVKAIN